jgi:hypothetical protein
VILPNDERVFNPSRETLYILNQAKDIGPQAHRLCEMPFGIEGRVGQRKLWGIVGLGRTYPHRLANSACERPMSDGVYSYKHVKALTERLVADALAAIDTSPETPPAQAELPLTQSAVALALASFGAGSMIAALALPGLLEKLAERRVMLAGIALMVVGMFAGTLVVGHASLMTLWFCLGLGYSTAQTPSGRLLRRSANPEDRPALFAAQFALSHACWLLFYPLAGWLGTRYGMPVTFAILGSSGAMAVSVALVVWPTHDPEVIEHEHLELPAGHAHIRGAGSTTHGVRHSHSFVVDDEHPRWPSMGG